MKTNASFVKQCAGMIAGAIILGWNAMSMGRDNGAKIQAEWTSKAIEDAYGREIGGNIRNNINAKFDAYRK